MEFFKNKKSEQNQEPNWSIQEQECLKECVQKQYIILDYSKTQSVKGNAWKAVQHDMLAAGYEREVNSLKYQWERIRAREWKAMAKEKRASAAIENRKPITSGLAKSYSKPSKSSTVTKSLHKFMVLSKEDLLESDNVLTLKNKSCDLRTYAPKHNRDKETNDTISKTQQTAAVNRDMDKDEPNLNFKTIDLCSETSNIPLTEQQTIELDAIVIKTEMPSDQSFDFESECEEYYVGESFDSKLETEKSIPPAITIPMEVVEDGKLSASAETQAEQKLITTPTIAALQEQTAEPTIKIEQQEESYFGEPLQKIMHYSMGLRVKEKTNQKLRIKSKILNNGKQKTYCSTENMDICSDTSNISLPAQPSIELDAVKIKTENPYDHSFEFLREGDEPIQFFSVDENVKIESEMESGKATTPAITFPEEVVEYEKPTLSVGVQDDQDKSCVEAQPTATPTNEAQKEQTSTPSMDASRDQSAKSTIFSEATRKEKENHFDWRLLEIKEELLRVKKKKNKILRKKNTILKEHTRLYKQLLAKLDVLIDKKQS